jgi:hypothetical protein
MNRKGKITTKESKTRISAAALMRLAGFSALLAGLAIVVLGMFHPANEPAPRHHPHLDHRAHLCYIPGLLWCVRPGRALRQTGRKGWLARSDWLPPVQRLDDTGGILFFHRSRVAASTGERVPAVRDRFPGNVKRHSQRGEPRGHANDVEHLYADVDFGSLLFAIATFRARILPRWAAAILALGSVMVPVGALVSTEIAAKIIMVPMGLGLAWMGYALLTERREKSEIAVLDERTARLQPSKTA